MKGFFNSKTSHKLNIDQKIEQICVITGEVEKLYPLVKKKQSIAELRFDGWSPLQAAAFNCHLDVVKYLLENNLVPIDIRDQIGCSALHLAAWRGSDRIALAILNVDPKYEPISNIKHNHVHYAVCSGHLPLLEALSKYGRGPFETPCKDGITPFILACKVGRLDIVKYLLNTYKFDLEITDNASCTALHHACWEGHPRIISYLLERGANLHALNSFGQSPLNTCQTIDMKELVMSIALHHERNDPEPMQLPDSSPPPVPQEVTFDDHDEYLFFVQGMRDYVESIEPVGRGIYTAVNFPSQLRLELGGSLLAEIRSEFDQHASIPFDLSNGCSESNREIPLGSLSLPQQNGVDDMPPNTAPELLRKSPILPSPPELVGDGANNEGNDTFTITETIHSEEPRRSTQRELLDRLSNPMPSEGVQSLLLSICKRTGDVLALTTLIRSHPEALHENIRDSKGSTPLHCAIAAGYTDLVQFFLQRHVYISIPDILGNTPLHLACFFGNTKIVNLILSSENSLSSAINLEGKTPLHVACHRGYLDVVRLLVECGTVAIDAIDFEGHTGCDLAKIWQHDDIVRYFDKLRHSSVELEDLQENNRDGMVVYHDGDCYLGLSDQPQYVESMEEEPDSVSDPELKLAGSNTPSGLGEDSCLSQELQISSELRKPLIEICNGVIFEETFDDDIDCDNGELKSTEFMKSVCTQTEERNVHDVSLQCDTTFHLQQTSSTQTEIITVHHVGVECTPRALIDSNWIPFLLTTSRILSIRQGFLFAKAFYKWKSLRPFKKLNTLKLIDSLRLLNSMANIFHQLLLQKKIQKTFFHWKSIPRRVSNIVEITKTSEIAVTVTTPHPHVFGHGVDDTPMLDIMTPNIPGMVPLTPHSDTKIVQRLRFNDVVDIALTDSVQEKEDDLAILGPLPVETLPLFKSNEGVLWEMLTFYVANKLSIPSHKIDEKKRITKRIISPACLWNLFSDFSVCPTVCSKTSLKNIIDSLLSPHQLPTVFLPPGTNRPKIKSTDAVVSFLGFQKILWAIARDCLDAPSGKDPISRLLSLFSRLESSPGRKKMASHPRNAQVLPPFVLGDQIQKRSASKTKSDSSMKKNPSPSPTKTANGKETTPHKSNGQSHLSHPLITQCVKPFGGIGAHSEHRNSSQGQTGYRSTLSSSPVHITESPLDDNHVKINENLLFPDQDKGSSHRLSPKSKDGTNIHHFAPLSMESENQLIPFMMEEVAPPITMHNALSPIIDDPPEKMEFPILPPTPETAHLSSEEITPKILENPKIDSTISPIPPPTSEIAPPQVEKVDSTNQTIQIKINAELPKLETSHSHQGTHLGRPPLSPWSSSRHLGTIPDDVVAATSTPDETLEELTKAPVADRMNAKLAAKQFEALVSKLKTEPVRGVSPVRERSASITSASQSSDTDKDTIGALPKAKRPPMPHPLRRNQSERTYTQSIWLSDNPDEQKKSEKAPDHPPKKLPAPMLRRASEKMGIGNLVISTDVENPPTANDPEGNKIVEPPRATTPNRRDMWGQTFKDEGKIQGALNLWRKSARDFNRQEEEQEVEQTGSTDPGHDSGIDGGLNTYSTDGEIPSDSDYPITPNSRHRKHRGFTTRRR